MADITAVLKELQQERDRLDQAIRVLGSLAVRRDGFGSLGRRSRPPLSLAARRKIAAAQRARWAKVRSGNSGKAHPGKRVMSIAARRNAAAQRARWAKVRQKQEKKAA